MAPHYTDSEVMAIFMAGAAAATRDGRQSLERMERWTAEEYLGQVNVLVSKGWWSGAVEAETSKTLRTSGEVLWRYYNTNIIPTLRNVVYPTWAALMNKHGYVEVPSGKQLDDMKHELKQSYWKKTHTNTTNTSNAKETDEAAVEKMKEQFDENEKPNLTLLSKIARELKAGLSSDGRVARGQLQTVLKTAGGAGNGNPNATHVVNTLLAAFPPLSTPTEPQAMPSGWEGDRYLKVFFAFGHPAKDRAHSEIMNLGHMRDGPRVPGTQVDGGTNDNENGENDDDAAPTIPTTHGRADARRRARQDKDAGQGSNAKAQKMDVVAEAMSTMRDVMARDIASRDRLREVAVMKEKIATARLRVQVARDDGDTEGVKAAMSALEDLTNKL